MNKLPWCLFSSCHCVCVAGCVSPFNDSSWRPSEGSTGPFVAPPLFPLSYYKDTCGHLTSFSLIFASVFSSPCRWEQSLSKQAWNVVCEQKEHPLKDDTTEIKVKGFCILFKKKLSAWFERFKVTLKEKPVATLKRLHWLWVQLCDS